MCRSLLKALHIVVAALSVFSGAASAQGIRVGDRVRVHTADGILYDGKVRVLTASLIGIQAGSSETLVSLPLTSVEHMWVNRPRRHPGLGAILGVAGGAAVGAWAANHESYVLTSAVLLGIVGLPVGLIVGALVKTNQWEDGFVAPSISTSVSPQGRFHTPVSVPLAWRR